MENLRLLIRRIDGRGYKGYKSLVGRYDFPIFSLAIPRIQGDPFAPPSVLRIAIPLSNLPYSPKKEEETPFCDFVSRISFRLCKRASRKRGSGKSGLFSIPWPGQAVLQHSSCYILGDELILRAFVGLPAMGRRIAGREAEEMLLGILPSMVSSLLEEVERETPALKEHIVLFIDQEWVRKQLSEKGLVSFVRDRSSLPRKSGISQEPMEGAKLFTPPSSMKVEFDLPSGKRVEGMGIHGGVTLIVGGGFHGKTTLLEALQLGIYNHIKGDGREFVISREDVVKIRAEDGRFVGGVDISSFIPSLPSGEKTTSFTSQDASGTTSMAASIAEGMEIGASCFLFDEDTSATNFMIKDRRMADLIKKEPIVPYVARARELNKGFGVSSILVIGGAGEYLDVCDEVVLMEEYKPCDAGKEAKAVVKRHPGFLVESEVPLRKPNDRKPVINIAGEKVKAGRRELLIGWKTIDLVGVEQLICREQVNFIGAALKKIRADGRKTMKELLDEFERAFSMEGFELFGNSIGPDLAIARKQEIGAAMSRFRALGTS